MKSVAMVVMLAAAPAFAQEGGHTDFATIKNLIAQAAGALTARGPGSAALSLAQPRLSDEIAQVLRAPRENRLKVAPR
ncbi:MAG TPA: hypothetical protein VGH63_05195 [Polyangia bacterium]